LRSSREIEGTQEATVIIEKLPNECSMEEIQYHLYVIDKVHNGFTQIDNGEFLSHEEAKGKLSKWLTK